MSTAYRLLASAFGYSPRPFPLRQSLASPSDTAPRFSGQDTWSCAPWTGLCFEETSAG
jgi:hypothetical protein